MTIEITHKIGKLFGHDVGVSPWQFLILLVFRDGKYEPLHKRDILIKTKEMLQAKNKYFSETELRRLKHFDTLHNPNAFHKDINFLIKNGFLKRPKIKGEYICRKDLCEYTIKLVFFKRKILSQMAGLDMAQKSERRSKGEE